MFKMQVQDDENDPRSWHDVRGPEGSLLIFESEAEARARLPSPAPDSRPNSKHRDSLTCRLPGTRFGSRRVSVRYLSLKLRRAKFPPNSSRF